jgi:V/A-type H+/Na+-transporting ATPase subunit I
MSIVAMQRVSLCGLLREKAGALEGLQALGVMHLVPLRAPEPLAPDDPEKRRRAEVAFRHIMDAPQQLKPYRFGTEFDADKVIGQIIANRRKLRELGDRRDALAALIEVLAPWGDFTLPLPEELGGQRVWLYPLPVRERHVLDKLALPWMIVGRRPTVLHVAVISAAPPPTELLPVARIEAGEVPLSRLRDEFHDMEIALEKAEMERASLTHWRLLLGADLAAAQDQDDLRNVAEQTRDEEAIFAVQGWTPADAVAAVEAFAAERGLAVLAEGPRPEDMPPTLLRHGDDRAASGGDLTNFYTSPGYRSWDPSLVVYTSFAIFFAMIIADAGYAVLFALGTAFFWRRMGQSASGRRVRTLLAGLCATSFAYGVAAGSYFGYAPPPGTLLAALDVVDVADFEKMMRVSVFIGVLHIGLALGVVAWLNRGTGKAISSLGWIVVMAAGLVLWLGGEEARTLGFGLLAAGLASVFVGAAAVRRATSAKDWLLRIVDGLMGLTGLTKLFGDLLSYLRLFALGLASASLAATFNQLAADIHSANPGLGLLFAGIVLLFGHAINILIGIMSGVVHGLRLNYIEFFGWGLTEEGYPFRAFAKREAPV